MKHYKRLHFLSMLAMMIAPMFNSHLVQIGEGGSTEGDDEKKKALLKEIEGQTVKLIAEKNAGSITKEVFEAKMKEFKEEVEKNSGSKEATEMIEKFEGVEKQMKEYKEMIEKQGAEITSLKESGKTTKEGFSFKEAVAKALNSETFKKYSEDGSYKGKSGAIELKGVVDITNDYTGTVLISSRSNRVLDHPANRKLYMRDVISVMPTDMPFHVYSEVYTWDKNIAMETENGTLNESSFLVREVSTGTKRLGTFVKISKRMLKSLPWLTSHLSTKLPDALKFVEDYQILFGDNTGNNLNGIVRNAQAFDLTYATYIATAFTSIAQYGTNAAADDGTLITFAAAHSLKNGDILTLANTTGATYDGDHIVNVVSATVVMITQDYDADANVAANWTGSAKNAMYHKVNGAQQIDVLIASVATLNRGEYQATGIAINPIEAALIRMLKSTTEEYLKAIEIRNGIIYIANVPVIETNAMPAGYFLVGDFQRAVELLEFSGMTLEFADDVSYKLANQVAVIIQEEVILPIYNKYMFVYGDFTTAKSELETP